jgi:hypothetical protein
MAWVSKLISIFETAFLCGKCALLRIASQTGQKAGHRRPMRIITKKIDEKHEYENR